MFGGVKVNENRRKRYNRELMQLFGDLDILWFDRISRLDWFGRDNRTESKKEKWVRYLIIMPREVEYEDDQKTYGGTVYRY